MGRRVNISQPAVIQTELRPLDESFWIDADGSLEQWYYQNTGAFAPDRQITRLKLTPHLSAIDADTNTAYTPTFAVDRWEVKEWNGTQWVTTTITSLSQSDSYSIDTGDGLSLLVTKNNYDGSHAINITCHAKYNDPRDTGVQRWVSESTMLITSIDATQVFPTIDVKNPSARMFNPLKDDPIYEFEGTCDWEGLEGQGGTVITEYKADALGTEEILPANEDMVVNAAPLLDVTYGDVEKTGQQFMSRQTAGGAVSEIVDGVAKITNIKGDTVKLNQYINPSNIVTSSNEFSNLSFNNGSFSYKFTTNNTSQHGTGIGIQNFAFIAGHKYYYSSRFDAAPDNLLNYYFRGVGTNVEVNLGTNKNIKGVYSCTSTQTASIAMIGLVVQGASAAIDIKQSKYNLVDLTEMFGSGNEPSTAAAFEQWLSTHVGNLDYIPYTEGKLVNYGGFSVKFNQLVNITTATSGGVTITKNKDGSYTVSGSNSSTQYISLSGSVSSSQSHKMFVKVRYTTSQTVTIYDQANASGSTYINLDKSVIYTATNAPNLTLQRAANVTTDTTFFVVFIDLTIMFGAGNEPDLEWCNKYLSRDYYPYCPALDTNILSVMTTKEVVSGVPQYKSLDMGIKTTGFNLWDEAYLRGTYSSDDGKTFNANAAFLCAQNYIKVEAGKSYYFKGDSAPRIFFYDASYSMMQSITPSVNTVFTVPSDVSYIKFQCGYSSSTYNNDICINISDPSKNGTYEPHWESFSDMSWITKIGIENFNIWDEEWGNYRFDAQGAKVADSNQVASENFIKVKAGGRYCVTYGGSNDGIFYLFEYDTNKGFITITTQRSLTKGQIVTLGSTTEYIQFALSSAYGTTYNHDICINESNPHFNGRYYPHGETAPYFPNGLCNVGDVYDEIKVENGKIKGVVRIGSVDLGDAYLSGNGSSFYAFSISNARIVGFVCSKYNNIGYVLDAEIRDAAEGSIGWGSYNGLQVIIKDSTLSVGYNDALKGVKLIYELATPYEFEIDYPTKGQFEWYGINGSGSEVPIDQLPVYSQATQPSGYGQHTSKININALYGEDISVILRVKRYPWSANLMPMKVYRNVTWRIPPVDVQVVSDKGGAVRAQNESGNFTFSTIVNQQGDIISDEVKQANMVFDWYYAHIPNSGTAQTVSAGSGLTKAIAASSLKNTKPNNGETPCTNVWCEAFVLGAYHLVNGTYQRTKD